MLGDLNAGKDGCIFQETSTQVKVLVPYIMGRDGDCG